MVNIANPIKAIKQQTTRSAMNSCCVIRYIGPSTGIVLVAFIINPKDQPTTVPFIYNEYKQYYYVSAISLWRFFAPYLSAIGTYSTSATQLTTYKSSFRTGNISPKSFCYLILKSLRYDERCVLFCVKSFNGSQDIAF